MAPPWLRGRSSGAEGKDRAIGQARLHGGLALGHGTLVERVECVEWGSSTVVGCVFDMLGLAPLGPIGTNSNFMVIYFHGWMYLNAKPSRTCSSIWTSRRLKSETSLF